MVEHPADLSMYELPLRQGCTGKSFSEMFPQHKSTVGNRARHGHRTTSAKSFPSGFQTATHALGGQLQCCLYTAYNEIGGACCSAHSPRHLFLLHLQNPCNEELKHMLTLNLTTRIEGFSHFPGVCNFSWHKICKNVGSAILTSF